MINKKLSLLATLAALTIMLSSMTVRSQTTSVLATDLKAPIKIVLTIGGNLLVAEAGNGPNTGRVSLVDRAGNRRTLLDGLPSGLAFTGDPSGPSGLALSGSLLYISIGAGDATVSGPRPATEAPNPNGPSSPILSSVLSVEFGSNIDTLTSGFTLTAADHFRLASGFSLTLNNQSGAQAIVTLLVDFRDYVADPNIIVRASNPFGLALRVNALYVVDASQNSAVRVDTSTGRAQTVFTFARVANPTPVGAPMIDPVPDSIRLFGFFGEKFLVPTLTGFPFPSGAAEVRQVDLTTGAVTPFITGLTAAIDILPVGHPLVNPQFFVLEFSTNMLSQPRGPGRLRRFDSPTATPVVIANTLTSPTSMAYDPVTRELFVTEIFTGRIIRVQGL
jgi:hypothetical protein